MEVEGRDVREVAHGWLVLDGAQIPSGRAAARPLGREVRVPWHRILRIELDGEVVWARRTADPAAGPSEEDP